MSNLSLKNKIFGSNQTLIMGILNVTPDSFSDGGNYMTVKSAISRAMQMVKEGVDIIDIGGESTKPGSTAISAKEEWRRVEPVLKHLKELTDVPISIDTYKCEVAENALHYGVSIINDIWGAKKKLGMADLAASSGAMLVLTHNRDSLRYNRFLEEVTEELQESIDIALSSGVNKEQLIVDPGIGFSKTFEQNLFLLQNLTAITSMGYPTLLGTSRKSVIQKVLNLPPEEVNEGTAATCAYGIMQGCRILRIHDVVEMKKLAMMCDAIQHVKLY